MIRLVTPAAAAHVSRRRAREQAHADALACDAIHTAAYTRGHAHGRVSGRRIGYDAGHADGCLARVSRAPVAPERDTRECYCTKIGDGREIVCAPCFARAASDQRAVDALLTEVAEKAGRQGDAPPGFNDSEGDEVL